MVCIIVMMFQNCRKRKTKEKEKYQEAKQKHGWSGLDKVALGHLLTNIHEVWLNLREVGLPYVQKINYVIRRVPIMHVTHNTQTKISLSFSSCQVVKEDG